MYSTRIFRRSDISDPCCKLKTMISDPLPIQLADQLYPWTTPMQMLTLQSYYMYVYFGKTTCVFGVTS